MKKNTMQGRITQAGWDVDLDDEVTPIVCIVLPDETEVMLRDQMANGWTVEKMTLGEGSIRRESKTSSTRTTPFALALA